MVEEEEGGLTEDDLPDMAEKRSRFGAPDPEPGQMQAGDNFNAEDADDMEEMSCSGTTQVETEEQRLMKQLKEQAEMQKLIQDEMDTQSLATTIHPSQVFKVEKYLKI